jgi:hypothetical protein
MLGVNFNKTCVDRERFQAIQCALAKIVSPNSAQQHGVVAQPPCHHGKVCRRAAQSRALRQDIP